MRLWKCTVQHTIYVATGDDDGEDEAEVVACDFVGRAVYIDGLEADGTDADEVRPGLIAREAMKLVPYGDANAAKATCEAILMEADDDEEEEGR